MFFGEPVILFGVGCIVVVGLGYTAVLCKALWVSCHIKENEVELM